MPYVGLAANSWNSSTGVSLGFTSKVSARIWTTRSQRITLEAGLLMPAYETDASPLAHIGIGRDLSPFVSAGYGWTIKKLVTLSADVGLDREYQVVDTTAPSGYEAEWLRFGAEVDVRVARKVGLTLRGAWSDELYGGTSSYPGFLVGTKLAF
jgi:hypothetical protein